MPHTRASTTQRKAPCVSDASVDRLDSDSTCLQQVASSTQGWYAARSAWGPLNVYTNIFITKAQAFLPHADPAVRKLLLRWTVAMPFLLRSHLLDYAEGSDSLEELLTATEVRLGAALLRGRLALSLRVSNCKQVLLPWCLLRKCF